MTEAELIQIALGGDKEALAEIILSVQDDLYNLSIRMLSNRQDAEDATQEIVIKLITKLSNFKGESTFKTWTWRIAINHLLNYRKRRSKKEAISFEDMERDLDTVLDAHTLNPEKSVQQNLLVEEAKIGCMFAMLQCLKDNERATYIMGEIFGITDQEGSSIFDITPATYRKRLSRARLQIRTFMNKKCGLYNPENPCRCAKRVHTAIIQKRIDPHNLEYAHTGENHTILDGIAQMDEIARAGALYRTHPSYQSPEFLQKVLDLTNFD